MHFRQLEDFTPFAIIGIKLSISSFSGVSIYVSKKSFIYKEVVAKLKIWFSLIDNFSSALRSS